ncbi:MAG: hypothetical protein ABI461_09805 [Polyangiaceae bacterium]
MPKILPPRPTRSSIPHAPAISSASSYSQIAARKPSPPPVRAELCSQDFEEILEAVDVASGITSIDDPIDVLFDAMEDLLSVESSIEAGAICLASLMKAIPCRGGIVHLYDAESREFVAVFALGPRAEHLVLTRAEESDALISASFRKHQPVVVQYGGETAARPVDRHAMLDASRGAMICPIVDGARFLGAIELVDALGPNGFDLSAQHGISYVAERYAGFLAEHGVVLANVVAAPSGFIS